jgi:hypothetical protein
MAEAGAASIPQRVLVGVGVVVALLGLAVAVVILPVVLYPVTGDFSVDPARLTEKEKLDVLHSTLQQQSGLRAVLVQIVAGLTLVSGAALAWRQYALTRREAVRLEQEKREDFHLDLFSEALKSLGADAPGLRIGGVYALGRLAEMSSSHRSACVDVLSTFVRTRRPWPPTPPRPDESTIMVAEAGRG